MLSPLDVENKAFSKSMRGYNCEEVDEFLDRVIVDLQTLLDEKERQNQQIEQLSLEVSKAKESEITVKSTIESAKKLMNDISDSAEKRAEAIVKNAYLDAEIIRRNAKEEVTRLINENNRMQQKLKRFKERYKHLLEEELNLMDNKSDDLLNELEFSAAPVKEEIMSEYRPEPVKEKASDYKAEKFADVSTKDTIVVNDKSVKEMLAKGCNSPENADSFSRDGSEK